MRKFILAAALTLLFTNVFSQNYLGYSKEYIMKALKSQRKDMKGPLIVKAANDNYIVYIAKDGRRAVYDHFKEVDFSSETGKISGEEICTNYISKNKCLSYSNCPEMDDVVRSLDSHFTRSADYHTWIDYSKSVPHEWVIVQDNDFFEVNVSELRK